MTNHEEYHECTFEQHLPPTGRNWKQYYQYYHLQVAQSQYKELVRSHPIHLFFVSKWHLPSQIKQNSSKYTRGWLVGSSWVRVVFRGQNYPQNPLMKSPGLWLNMDCMYVFVYINIHIYMITVYGYSYFYNCKTWNVLI